MNLSEAIRLGAMLRPQGFGTPSSDDTSCAMIAALEAVSDSYFQALERYQEFEGDQPLMYSKFPVLTEHLTNCPAEGNCTGGGYIYIEGLIYHLNDDYRWTREQIADHIETIEAALKTVARENARDTSESSVGSSSSST